MPVRPVKRSARVAERVREEIARMVSRDLSDPRILHAMVTEVTMPDDLQSAHVKVRLAAGGADPASRQRLLDGLRAASGLIRKGVGNNLGLRRAPEIRFVYDEAQDARDRIEDVLAEIRRDKS